MYAAISALGGRVRDAVIYELINHTYRAKVRIIQSERLVEIPYRVSDAVTLALISDTPIVVDQALFNEVAQEEPDPPPVPSGTPIVVDRALFNEVATEPDPPRVAAPLLELAKIALAPVTLIFMLVVIVWGIAPRPDSPGALDGVALERKGEYDAAIAAIAEHRKAIRLKPDKALYHRKLGDALRRKGDPDAAIAEIREALRLDPKKAIYHTNLGNAHAAMGRWDEATAEYAKAIALQPADYRPRYNYTLVRLAVGDFEGYRKACEDLLERFGQTDDPKTANTVAWILTVIPNATTEFDRPLRLAEKAVAGDPKDFNYLGTLGAALYRAGRFVVAVERLNEATEDQSQLGTINNAYNWLFLALAHHRLGHADDAREWLDKAVGRIDQLTREDLGTADVGIPLTWVNRLELRLLRREAEVLVKAERR